MRTWLFALLSAAFIAEGGGVDPLPRVFLVSPKALAAVKGKPPAAALGPSL